MSKTCFKCKVTKSVDDFYRHPAMGDGRLGKCKECTKHDVQLNYRARLEQYRAYDQERSPMRREYRKEATRKHRQRHPEKVSARRKVKYAVSSGKLTRRPCETCGDVTSEAHHQDYSQPLMVEWLCRRHHREREGRLAE